MIVSDKQLVNVTNRNVTNLREQGYDVSVGTPHLISIEHLGCRVKVDCKCDECGAEYTVTQDKINNINIQFCKSHRWEIYSDLRKEFWNTPDGLKIRKSKGIKISKSKRGIPNINTRGVLNGRYNPRLREFKRYAYAVRQFTTLNFKSEVQNLPNFEKTGRAGIEGAYQLDHKVSIKYGFENNISPEIIGHIENLEMIPWELNRSKDINNSISLTDLQEFIENYHRKQ